MNSLDYEDVEYCPAEVKSKVAKRALRNRVKDMPSLEEGEPWYMDLLTDQTRASLDEWRARVRNG